jgi:hypothetical protein
LSHRRERFVVSIFLFFLCLQLAHFVHNGWFMYDLTYSQSLQPRAQRGDTFRLAIPALIRLITKIFHFHDGPLIMAGLDFVTGFFSLYLLYLLTVDTPLETPDRPKDRALKIMCFLAIIQFPIAWVVPWQRPETLPSTLFLAFSLLCLSKIGSSRLWSLPILFALPIQAFVRSDVAIIFGIAIALVGLWTIVKHVSQDELRVSRYYVVLGTLIAIISGGIQAYLHTLYPEAGVDIQVRTNLGFHGLEVLTILLAPFISFFLFLIAKRPPVNIVEKVIIASALLYLPMYFTFGIAGEARIYVPFLLILCVVTARVSASYASTKLDLAS